MLAELKKYKELIYFLVHKEVRIRYRNSLFGFFWSLLEPLGLMIIYTIVFALILKLSRGIDNYPLYILSGLIPWVFFNDTLKKSMQSLSRNASLIKKIYFPREIFPFTTLIANVVANFLPAMLLVIALALILQPGEISWFKMLFAPGIVLLQAVFTFGLSLVLSVLNVFYRDVEFISNLVLRGWMYLSPIIYPLSFVPEEYFNFYVLNPMAVIVSLYHDLFYSNLQTVPTWSIFYVIVFSIIQLFVAMLIFKRLNRRVGEVI